MEKFLTDPLDIIDLFGGELPDDYNAAIFDALPNYTFTKETFLIAQQILEHP